MTKTPLLLLLVLMLASLPQRAFAYLLDGFAINAAGSATITGNEVRAVAVQPWDGKVLIGGDFTITTVGSPSVTRSNLARLNTDGSLDTNFTTIAEGPVNAIAVASDPADPDNPALGKIYVGGFATVAQGKQKGWLAKLTVADGALETAVSSSMSAVGESVNVVALHPDGRSILVGGMFASMWGGANNLAQLSTDDLSVRVTFSAGGADAIGGGAVNAILVQDGNIVVGGSFTSPQGFLARYKADGTRGPGFSGTPNGAVRALALQADGKIVVGGDFSSFGGSAAGFLVRVTANGALDSFNPSPDGYVATLAIQPDGKILAGGNFMHIGGGAASHLARLKIGGTLQPMPAGADAAVNAVVLQPDGKFLAAGVFSSVAGVPRTRLARFYANGYLDDNASSPFPYIANAGLGALAIAQHPDGVLDVISWLDFTNSGAARLSPDYSFQVYDHSFTYNDDPLAVAQQQDGNILVSGRFTKIGGQTASFVTRLGPDLKPDPVFAAKVNELFKDIAQHRGIEISVAQTLALHPRGGHHTRSFKSSSGEDVAAGDPLDDGLIYVGGIFYPKDGVSPATYLVRLKGDGSPDPDFNPVTIKRKVTSILIQPDDKILVAGGDPSGGFVTRLHTNGDLDPGFDTRFDATVAKITPQKDGRLLVTGYFTNLTAPHPAQRHNLARLYNGNYKLADGSTAQDGSLDPSLRFWPIDNFYSDLADYNVTAVYASYLYGAVPQADGGIIVFGQYDEVSETFDPDSNRPTPDPDNPIYLDGICRLGIDGTLEKSRFLTKNDVDVSSYSSINAIELQHDGKLMVAGSFSGFQTSTRPLNDWQADGPDPLRQDAHFIARFANGWATQKLTVAPDPGNPGASLISWTQGGTSPLVWGVTFEESDDPDAGTWSLLGRGVPAPDGGWQLSTTSLVSGQNRYLRARGYISGGGLSSNTSIMEAKRLYYLNTAGPSLPVLTVRARGASRVYGSGNPAAVAEYVDGSGSVVVPTSVSGAPVFTCSAGIGSNVGNYDVNVDVSGLSSPDYTFTAAKGTLTVTPLPVTVTADAKSINYGDAEPSLTYTVAPALVGSDSFSGALSRGAGADVGSYAILQGSLALSSNYALSYAGASLSIKPRTVTVTADPQEKSYGDPDPSLSYQVAPALVGSDSFSGALGRVPGNNVGSYPIQQGSLALGANYQLSFAGANLTVTAKTITVTADAKSKPYGDADPQLSYSFSPALSGSDAFSGTLQRVAGESVAGGPYPIQQGSLALSGNYAINFSGTTLTITPRPATVTPTASGKNYGSTDPTLTGTLTGFVPGDGVAAVYSRSPGESVSGGPYTISANLAPVAVLGNYAITYNAATFTIGKKEASVKAEDAGKVYGQSDPLLQCTKIDFMPSDLGAGKITCYSLRDQGQNVGGYPITPGLNDNGSGLLANYNVQYLTASFTITKAPLAITADSKSRPYGADNPPLTASYAGLVNGDTPPSLGGSPALTTAADPGSPKGNYPIRVEVGSIASANYDYSFVDGTLTVTGSMPQTISFAPLRPRTYGDADFDPGATATSGLPVSYRSSDDGISKVVDGKLRVVAPGNAVIAASQQGDDNYEAAAEVAQTLKINPPPWNALGFDGVDDLMLVPDGTQLNFGGKGGVTIETWLHLEGAQPDGTGLVAKGAGGAGYQLLLSQNRIAAEIGDGARRFGVADGLVGSTSLNDGRWHHVAFSLDRVGGTAALYLDGRLEAQFTAPPMNPDNVEPLRIGVDASGARFFKGEIDELRLWDSGRSRDEIRGSFARIIDPLDEAHLMAYFHFDQGDAGGQNGDFPSAPERTANGAHGTLQNFALNGDASNWIRSGAFLPLLETTAVTPGSAGSAAGGGVVYPNYYPASDVGLCWGIAPNPTLDDSCVHAGSGVGAFSANLTGLTPGASYHVRAFASNEMGTAYGNDLYFNPDRLPQSISFVAPPDKSYGDPPFTPQGSASSGLPVSYTSSNPEVAVVVNGNIVITGAGSSIITASQSGNESYASAPELSVTLNVAQARLAVRGGNKARAYLTPNPAFTYTISGFVNGENSSVLTGAPLLSTAATLESPVADYSIVVATGSLFARNYSFVPVNGVLSILKSCQEIIFPSVGERTYGDPPFNITAAACSGLGLVFTSSNPQVAQVSGATVTITGAGSAVITAAQPGSSGLEKAPEVSQTVVVNKSGQQLSLLAPGEKLLGDPPFTLVGNSSSALPVSYSSSDPSVATVEGNVVTIVGAGTTVITAHQEGGSNYNAALPVSQPLVVLMEAVPPTLLLSTLPSGAVTSDPVLNVTGSASDASGIASVTVNDAEATSRSELFSSAVPLATGENSIKVTARDRAGNQATQTLSVTLDALAPAITLSLADNSISDQSPFTVTGTVNPGSALSMSVNGGSPQSLAATGGRFSGNGYLEEGVNTVVFMAELEGRSSRVKRSVTFAPGKPAAAITDPAQDIRTEQTELIIRGAAPTAVSVLLEVEGTSFTPALQAGGFEQKITLPHPGQSTVIATVTDSSGNTSIVQRNIIKRSR